MQKGGYMKALKLSIVIAMVLLLIQKGYALEKIKACYGSIGVEQGIGYIAKESKSFEKNGLDVELILVAGQSIQALVSGDVKFAFMGGSPAIHAKLEGHDVVIVGGTSHLNQICVTSPEIKKVTDLKGKRAGISKFGTITEYAARIVLKKSNLQAQKDVALIQIGSGSDRIMALKSGAISMAVMERGQRLIAEKQGLTILAEINDNFLNSVWVMDRKFIKENRDIAKRVVKGIVDGLTFSEKNPEETKKILGSFFRTGDEKVISDQYIMLREYPARPYIDKKAIENALEVMKEAKAIKEGSTLKIEDFLDMTLLQEVERENK
jgi:ABC-type nitrate/sulfonate/bicarbonate transport system substrate-binding protein